MALMAATGSDRRMAELAAVHPQRAFGVTDPQFHRDVGFFVFKLPFLVLRDHWG